MNEKPIALGRTAEIFNWQNGQIPKLYREYRSLVVTCGGSANY
jgi:hypothetical protein